MRPKSSSFGLVTLDILRIVAILVVLTRLSVLSVCTLLLTDFHDEVLTQSARLSNLLINLEKSFFQWEPYAASYLLAEIFRCMCVMVPLYTFLDLLFWGPHILLHVLMKQGWNPSYFARMWLLLLTRCSQGTLECQPCIAIRVARKRELVWPLTTFAVQLNGKIFCRMFDP